MLDNISGFRSIKNMFRYSNTKNDKNVVLTDCSHMYKTFSKDSYKCMVATCLCFPNLLHDSYTGLSTASIMHYYRCQFSSGAEPQSLCFTCPLSAG